MHRERLQAYGLSINDVVNAVRSANLNLPSGRITEGERDYDARIIGEFQSIEELRQLRVPVRQATGVLNLRLEDVADIQDTVEDRSQFTRIYEVKNGKLVGGESVGLTITKLSDANTVQVIEGVKKELADLEKELPGQVHFVLAWDQSDYIKASLEDVNISLILGALLAVLVIFLFLHNLRGTVICAIAIPTSLVAAFIPMHFLGFTMNQMTMLGLSLVVGILVDDSIVVLENIYRHLHRGERPREAAYNGRSEIGLAAITITLVDVVVFVPVAFMGGIVGQFFRQFGLTVAVSTLFSLLVSFTVTPMLASRWYKIGEDVEEKRGLFKRFDDFYHSLDRGYRKLLGWALRHRWTVVFGGVATLGVVLFGLGPRMGFQFFPELDQGRVTVTIELPPGAALDRTDRIVKQVEQAVAPIPEVHNIFSSIGNISGGMGMGVERGRQYAQVNLSLIDKRGLGHTLGLEKAEGPLRTRADQEIATEVRQRLAGIPGARFVVSTVSASAWPVPRSDRANGVRPEPNGPRRRADPRGLPRWRACAIPTSPCAPGSRAAGAARPCPRRGDGPRPVERGDGGAQLAGWKHRRQVTASAVRSSTSAFSSPISTATARDPCSRGDRQHSARRDNWSRSTLAISPTSPMAPAPRRSTARTECARCSSPVIWCRAPSSATSRTP